MKNFCVLIPAYNPSKELVELVSSLVTEDFLTLVIVNDGSRPECDAVFSAIKQNAKVIVLDHAVNLGKGAALKTGLNYIYTRFSSTVGVVTADADGQHSVEDICKVGRELLNNPHNLILGVREFIENGKKIPLRSRLGNLLTIKLFKLIVGQKITDTQSGLRGIPLGFIPTLLTIQNNGYEFELSMLIDCKYMHWVIREVPIKTIYIDNNKSSHFNPLIDSLKIYFVLFRFILLSISSAVLDFLAFSLLFSSGMSVLGSQGLARAISVAYNYPMAKKLVFRYKDKSAQPLVKYLILVMINCMISLIVIDFCVTRYSFAPIVVKAVIESLLFLANFAIQRDFIFTKKKSWSLVRR